MKTMKIKKDEIIEIERIKENDLLYDLHTKTKNYIAEDIIVHNSKPNKRGFGTGVYLPSILKESVHIVISIDTSGSIGKEELEEFLGELLGITDAFPALNMDVIICDAEIHETYRFSADVAEEVKNMSMSGGGGTSHVPVYNYVEENLEDCKVLINFTDGWTEFPNDPDKYMFRTLWVISKKGYQPDQIPFGKVIKLE